MHDKKLLQLVGAIIVAICIGTLGYTFLKIIPVPLIFSPSQVLGALWAEYKMQTLEPGTMRTLDRGRGNITTSEGESYTMLRAVWIGDQDTFDASWRWTTKNLERTNDHLFAWLYGERSDGTYGVLVDQGGLTTASDADTDIALALIFAYARWQDPAYLSAARAIVNDIWNNEVILIKGKPYLVANNLEKSSSIPSALINPSYLNPAAYRIFARIDPIHPWHLLVDNSYALLMESMRESLDKKESVGLPPDYVRINKKTGLLEAPGGSLTTNFGFDALRIPYRIALDAEWSHDPRATAVLDRFTFLDKVWQQDGKIGTTYTHDGTVVAPYETIAMYGGTLGYFLFADPDAAKNIYERKILANYDPSRNTWSNPLSYYDDNLAWFGIGVYNHLLPDLTTSTPPASIR